MKLLRLSALVILLLSPTLALAHPLHFSATDFQAGFLHPFGGADHLLAMLAVGLLGVLGSAQSERARVSSFGVLPAAFVAAALAGMLLGRQSELVSVVEPLAAASVLMLGLLIAWRVRFPAAAIALVAVFGLVHGMAHGAESAAQGVTGFAMGFVLASLVLHGVGMFAGLRLQACLPRARLAGVPLVIAGTVLLSQALLAG